MYVSWPPKTGADQVPENKIVVLPHEDNPPPFFISSFLLFFYPFFLPENKIVGLPYEVPLRPAQLPQAAVIKPQPSLIRSSGGGCRQLRQGALDRCAFPPRSLRRRHPAALRQGKILEFVQERLLKVAEQENATTLLPRARRSP